MLDRPLDLIPINFKELTFQVLEFLDCTVALGMSHFEFDGDSSQRSLQWKEQ